MTLVQALVALRARLAQGWRPSVSLDPAGVLSWPCRACRRVHPCGECPPSDCEATSVCLDDALTLATGFEVELFMEAELLLREIAEPLAARGLHDWERAEGRTQAEVQRVVGKALMRASAMERSQNGGRS